MKPAWSSKLALLAVAALVATGGAAPAGSTGEALARTPGAATFEAGSEVWLQFRQWLDESYARAPALMLGLAILLAVPPLALAGLIVRRNRRSSEATVRLPRSWLRAPARRATTVRTEVSPWPSEAWVEVVGPPGGRCLIGRSLVRIGREGDNDIRLAAKTVHRYHAVIRRTTDGDVVITDVSGQDGNGVLVNGARVLEARLKKGDVINVGEVKMRFDLQAAQWS